MHARRTAASTLGLLWLLGGPAGAAAGTLTIDIDEAGHGSYGAAALPGSAMTASDGTHSFPLLVYHLPDGVFLQGGQVFYVDPGDVIPGLQDPLSGSTRFSDVLLISGGARSSDISVWSLGGGGKEGDVPWSPWNFLVGAPDVFVREGSTYTPASGQPGFDLQHDGATAYTLVFHSDEEGAGGGASAPEPATVLLLGLGLAGLAGMARPRR